MLTQQQRLLTITDKSIATTEEIDNNAHCRIYNNTQLEFDDNNKW